MGRFDIQVFWKHRSKRDAKDKKTIRALNKKVKNLNKHVKVLNAEVAQMNKGTHKPVEVVHSALYILYILLTDYAGEPD